MYKKYKYSYVSFIILCSTLSYYQFFNIEKEFVEKSVLMFKNPDRQKQYEIEVLHKTKSKDAKGHVEYERLLNGSYTEYTVRGKTFYNDRHYEDFYKINIRFWKLK